MAERYPSLLLDNFSGGLTDNPKVKNPTKFEVMDNVLISDDLGIYSRPGSDFFHATANRVLNGENVDHLIDFALFDEDLPYYFWISGRHLYQVTSVPAITDLLGPTGNLAFNLGTAGTTRYDKAFWKGHLLLTNDLFAKPIKLYNDGTNFNIRTAGLPAFTTPPTVTAGAAGANTYVYAFVRYYTYTVGTVVYEDFGSVTYVGLSSAAAPNANPVAITAIESLSNGATLNYDTANIKIKIYRTKNGLTTMYYLGEVTNGTLVYTDNTADTALSTTVLYTDGGELDNDEPPTCKYIEIVNNKAYYSHVIEDGETKGFRTRISKANDIDSCPADLFVDTDGNLTASSSFNDFPILFEKNKTYRVVDTFDAFGRGYAKAVPISKNIGCVSNDSVIKTDEGLLFAGNVGWCYTDGYRVIKISEDLNTTYKQLISTTAKALKIVGSYDSINKFAYWIGQREDRSLRNDTTFVMHLRYGISANSVFTTWSNYQPSFILVNRDNNLLRGDRFGYVFSHSNRLRNDPKVDYTKAPAIWSKNAIVPDVITSELDCGLSDVQKWGTEARVRSKNISNLSLQVKVANDNMKDFANCDLIRQLDQITWGARYYYWGDADYLWQNTRDITKIIKMASSVGFRFYTRQLEFTLGFVEIENSVDTCTATVDMALRTITLDNLAFVYPDYCDDHYIYIGDYRYLILERTSDTVITVTDPAGTLVDGSIDWTIKGYPKDELWNVQDATLYYIPLDKNFNPGGEAA